MKGRGNALIKGNGKTLKGEIVLNVSSDSKPAVACYQSSILENSPEDKAKCDGWIRCTKCSIWCHETCAEKGGLLDDDDVFCSKCVEQM